MSDRTFYGWVAILSTVVMLPIFYLLLERHVVSDDHILRGLLLNEFSTQFWSGDFYPRWLSEVNSGLGSPVLLLQPIIFYLPAVFLEPLSVWDPQGVFRLNLLFILFLLLGGISCHLWLKEHFDSSLAKKGALLFVCYPTLYPFLYVSTMLPTIFATMVLPLVFFFCDKISAGSKSYFYALSFTLAVLMMGSSPSSAIALPMIFAYALMLSRKNPKSFIKISFGILIALCISAYYWVPLIENSQYIALNIFKNWIDQRLIFPFVFLEERRGGLLFTDYLYLASYLY
jgi:hypothetical protein